jgi:hypothetical protein
MTDNPLFYVKSGEQTEIMAFAFTLDSAEHQEETRDCTGLFWTPAVQSLLKTVLDRARENSKKKHLRLPYSALRFDIEATASGLLSLLSDLGLNYFGKHDKPKAFLVAENQYTDVVTQQVNDSFNLWTTSEAALVHFCQRYQIDDQFIDRLDQLYTQEEVLTCQKEVIKPFDWQLGYQKTPKGNFTDSFEELSSALLKALSGVEIHPKLGKLLPVISRYRHNAVELMTKPLMMAAKDGKDGKGSQGEFSLRLKLSVETMPNYDKPIITATFTRTRWLDNKMAFLDDSKNKNWYNKDITGYVHDEGNSGRCIAFELFKNRESGIYEFRDDVYARMSERCGLPSNGTVTDLKNLRLTSKNANTVARAVYTNQMPSNHSLQHGFTTADRVIFFDAIAEPLSKIGVVPWTDWTEVRSKKVTKPKRSMLDLQTFLEGLIDSEEEVVIEEEKITAEILKGTLRKALSFEPERITDKLNGGDKKLDKLETVRDINIRAISHVFKTTPTLVVIGENHKRREIITEMVKRLVGDQVKVYQVQLPSYAYKSTKPKAVKQKAYLKTQVEKWTNIVDQIHKAGPMPIFALVEAPLWFKSDDGKPQKDYPLNKVATRMALANKNIACQYLDTPQTTKAGKIYLGDYLMRIQNALYDLLFAQSGYAEAVPESINALFTDKMAERKPRYVVGLAVIAKNKTRFKNRRKLIAAVRYDTRTDESSVKYSYWEGKSNISEWMPFTTGLFSISKLSKHSLGLKAEDIGNSIVKFCSQVIEEVAKDDPHALILVNPTHINSRYAWNWLQDKNMKPETLSIGKERFKKSSWKGLRIIRCRTDIPPSLCQRKAVVYTEIEASGNEQADKTATVQVHTTVPTLIRVNKTPIPTFLSVAPPKLQYKRGTSVFEKRELPSSVSDKGPGKAYMDIAPKVKGKTTYIMSEADIMTKPASSPKTIEFAIAHKHPEDVDEILIRFVESLRFGHAQYQDWTSLPFVLHAMSTIEEYVNTFQLEEDDDEESAPDAEKKLDFAPSQLALNL